MYLPVMNLSQQRNDVDFFFTLRIPLKTRINSNQKKKKNAISAKCGK